MGMGKTVSTLTAYSELIDEFMVNRVLVIAPLRVANTVWMQEAEQWEHLKHLTFSICTGPAAERRAALDRDSDIYVINRENIPWLVENYPEWKWDAIVIDESSSFKSSKSKRFKALKKVIKNCNFVTLLTGTPSPNGLKDLWPQIFLLDHGERLGRTNTAFVNRFYTKTGYMGYVMELNEGADKIIHKLIEDICLTMKSEDYLELPELIPIYERIQLEQDEKAMKFYRDIKKDFTAVINGENVDALSASTLGNKLIQICNGAIYDADRKVHPIHNLKIDRLKEIVEENEEENLLVAYNYKFDLHALTKAFPDAVVLDGDPETIERWNRGEIKMLLCHPASAGHGLNIQKGGSTIIWYGLNWSLELYQQFNKRLHRQGQEFPVRIIHIIADGLMDENIIEAINSKAKSQEDLLNYLKNKVYII